MTPVHCPQRTDFGRQKSGKSRRAEALAAAWLAAHPAHRALLVATAEAGDEEMRQRIARHQSDRAARVPRMQTLEEPTTSRGSCCSTARPTPSSLWTA